MNEPVFELRDQYNAESYWTDEYVAGATPVLQRLGWLTRPIGDEDKSAAERVLDGLLDLDLDETDVFPFGLLWALRSTGAIGDVDGLDVQLADWRRWEEDDHLGEPMSFLPALRKETR